MGQAKIKNPNAKSNSFVWILVAIVAIIAIVLAFILTKGNEKVNADTAFNVTVEGSSITLAADTAGPGTPEVDLYEDFMCPHCAELGAVTDDQMKEALNAGKVIVHIRDLNFLVPGEDGMSTRVGTAALSVAKTGDTKAFWDFRQAMMEQQSAAYTAKWDAAKLSEEAKKAGANSDAVKAIANDADKQEFIANATENAKTLKQVPPDNQVSSPRVIFNGADVSPVDQWVDIVTSS
ncbi:MAG: thioredoxin domain-containing protein [Corynebacterium sp.]|nr:thioredoxin domain-containing protein [Corynebacterium sp.]